MISNHTNIAVDGVQIYKQKQPESFLLTFIFTLLIAAFFILTFFDCVTGNSDIASENRLPTMFPGSRVFINNPPTYFKELENFVSDRFAFRHNLIASRNWLLYSVFSSSGNNEILFGKDGFMFLSSSAALHAQTHEEAFSPDELSRAEENFKAKSQWLKSHGIRYVLMVVPEKGTLYPEKLPGSLNVQSVESRLDTLRREIDLNHLCNFSDAKITLSEHKIPNHFLYRKYDSHWTEEGAVLVLQKLFNSLGLNISPMVQGTKLLQAGDLAKMIALGDYFQESGSTFNFSHRTARNLISKAKSVNDATINFAEYENPTPANSVRIHVIGDSFSRILMKFIPELTSHSSVQFYGDFRPQELLNIAPDIIVEEMVERHLYDWEFERCPQSVVLLHETSNKNATIGDGAGKPTFADFSDKLEIIDFLVTPDKTRMSVKILWRAKTPVNLDGDVHLNVWEKDRTHSLAYVKRSQDFLKRHMNTGDCWLDTFDLKSDKELFDPEMQLTISVKDANQKFLTINARETAWSSCGVYLPLKESSTSAAFGSLFKPMRLCYAQNDGSRKVAPDD